MGVRRLSQTEFYERAKPALDSVFRSLDVNDRPFADHVEARIILDTGDGFLLFEDQFAALSSAAQAEDDQSFFVSAVRGYSGGPESAPYYTCEAPLFEYEEYVRATHFLRDEAVPVPSEADLFIPLDQVLYSPHGTWGVFCPEIFALLGGSKGFVDGFLSAFPDWEGISRNFLSAFRMHPSGQR